jgi:hypothetical protein
VSAGAVAPGGQGEGSATPAPEPLASEVPPDATAVTTSDDSSDDSKSSRAGSIVLGLLAGCLAFGAALLVRRGWMRWRYGL